MPRRTALVVARPESEGTMTGPSGVWNAYLTERDKAFVAKVGQLPEKQLGRSPALLMIDHCNYATGKAPKPLLESMDENPMSCGLEAWDAVSQTRELLTACRAAGVPVFYTAPHGLERGSPRRLAGGLSDRAGDDPWTREIIADIAPVGDEILLRKLGASSFAGTPLDAILRRSHIDSLLLTGNTTSGCVRATAIDAAYLQFRTFVVEECVYDRTEAAHAMSLFDMHYKYAQVTPIARVIGLLAGGEAAPPGSATPGSV
jgi:maleamate amidohydrolase